MLKEATMSNIQNNQNNGKRFFKTALNSNNKDINS